MNDTPSSAQGAAAAGTITIGGDLSVNRLGFGAMRLTGRASGASPRTRKARAACCSGRWSSA